MSEQSESNGGETGIRTLGTLAGTHAFQACALGHYAISPWVVAYLVLGCLSINIGQANYNWLYKKQDRTPDTRDEARVVGSPAEWLRHRLVLVVPPPIVVQPQRLVLFGLPPQLITPGGFLPCCLLCVQLDAEPIELQVGIDRS